MMQKANDSRMTLGKVIMSLALLIGSMGAERVCQASRAVELTKLNDIANGFLPFDCTPESYSNQECFEEEGHLVWYSAYLRFSKARKEYLLYFQFEINSEGSNFDGRQNMQLDMTFLHPDTDLSPAERILVKRPLPGAITPETLRKQNKAKKKPAKAPSDKKEENEVLDNVPKANDKAQATPAQQTSGDADKKSEANAKESNQKSKSSEDEEMQKLKMQLELKKIELEKSKVSLEQEKLKRASTVVESDVLEASDEMDSKESKSEKVELKEERPKPALAKRQGMLKKSGGGTSVFEPEHVKWINEYTIDLKYYTVMNGLYSNLLMNHYYYYLEKLKVSREYTRYTNAKLVKLNLPKDWSQGEEGLELEPAAKQEGVELPVAFMVLPVYDLEAFDIFPGYKLGFYQYMTGLETVENEEGTGISVSFTTYFPDWLKTDKGRIKNFLTPLEPETIQQAHDVRVKGILGMSFVFEDHPELTLFYALISSSRATTPNNSDYLRTSMSSTFEIWVGFQQELNSKWMMMESANRDINPNDETSNLSYDTILGNILRDVIPFMNTPLLAHDYTKSPGSDNQIELGMELVDALQLVMRTQSGGWKLFEGVEIEKPTIAYELMRSSFIVKLSMNDEAIQSQIDGVSKEVSNPKLSLLPSLKEKLPQIKLMLDNLICKLVFEYEVRDQMEPVREGLSEEEEKLHFENFYKYYKHSLMKVTCRNLDSENNTIMPPYMVPETEISKSGFEREYLNLLGRTSTYNLF